MNVGDMTLFDALKARMQWHQTRQTVLAENIANAETPGFRARDLTPFAYEEHAGGVSTAGLTTQATQAGHIAVTSRAASGPLGPRHVNAFELTPDGNGVTLEDEMMKIAANQMDYQATTTLYNRSLRLIKVALGRSA